VLVELTPAPVEPISRIYEPETDALREQLETAVGDDFATIWSRGEEMDIYTAVDDALDRLSGAAVGTATAEPAKRSAR
jgi:hypothetical protein